jgi:hypothetical protein
MFTSLIKAFVNFSLEDEIVFADEGIVAGNVNSFAFGRAFGKRSARN